LFKKKDTMRYVIGFVNDNNNITCIEIRKVTINNKCNELYEYEYLPFWRHSIKEIKDCVRKMYEEYEKVNISIDYGIDDILIYVDKTENYKTIKRLHNTLKNLIRL